MRHAGRDVEPPARVMMPKLPCHDVTLPKPHRPTTAICLILKYDPYSATESGLAENDDKFIEILKESPRCIGGLEFREWVDERCEQIIAERSAPEDVTFRRVEEPLNPDVVLARLAQVLQVDVDEFRQRRRNSPLRAIASNFLIKYSGLSQREVATVLNVGSGSAISRQLLRYRKISTEDKKLNKLLMRCESSLKEDRIK